MSGKNNQRIQ